MAQVEIYSLATPTNVLAGLEHTFRLDRGEAALFDAESATPPIIVQPTDPGGNVILLAPQELASRSAAELFEHGIRTEEALVLGVTDLESIDLEILLPLAEYVARDGGKLVLRIGDA